MHLAYLFIAKSFKMRLSTLSYEPWYCKLHVDDIGDRQACDITPIILSFLLPDLEVFRRLDKL